MTTQLTKDEIRAVFMRNGFTIKDGQTDLKDYVYLAARELIAAHEAKQWIPCAEKLPEILPDDVCSDEVLAGYWFTDPYLVATSRNKHTFVCGAVRLIEDRGCKFWERFGSQPTHWKRINPPAAIAAQKGG